MTRRYIAVNKLFLGCDINVGTIVVNVALFALSCKYQSLKTQIINYHFPGKIQNSIYGLIPMPFFHIHDLLLFILAFNNNHLI